MNAKIKHDRMGNAAQKNDFFNSKDLVKFINKNEFSDQIRYSQIVIEWIREWPKKHQSQILSESLICNPNLIHQTELQPIDEDILWQTLVESDNIDLIKLWIEFSFSAKDAPVEKENYSLFQAKKLSQEMVDLLYSNPYLPLESKEVLLNYLATFNVYCTQEKSNFNLHALRLSSSGTLFDREGYKSRDDSFHLKVILNFLNKKSVIPFDFVWSYLNYYNSISEDNSAQSLLAHSQLIEINSSKSIRMMLAFRQNLKLTDLDPVTFFSNICTKNFEFYLNQVDNLQISNLFTHKYKEHHLVALALSLYFDVISFKFF